MFDAIFLYHDLRLTPELAAKLDNNAPVRLDKQMGQVIRWLLPHGLGVQVPGEAWIRYVPLAVLWLVGDGALDWRPIANALARQQYEALVSSGPQDEWVTELEVRMDDASVVGENVRREVVREIVPTGRIVQHYGCSRCLTSFSGDFVGEMVCPACGFELQ